LFSHKLMIVEKLAFLEFGKPAAADVKALLE
jgi:hypothetical protein